MTSRTKRIVAPFINDFGQVIHPNDEAFAVTTCTGRVSVKKVKYIGYIEREAFNWRDSKYEKQKFAQISTPAKKHVYYQKGTTDPFAWSFYNSDIPGDQQYDRVEVKFDQISTLQYNRILPITASLDEMAQSV